MQYRTLGQTGLVVSRFAFGAMTFTQGNRDLSLFAVEQRDADAMVGAAIEAGVNLFDTSDNYAAGESEMVLGRALASRRDDVVIATKVGFRTGNTLTQAGLSRRHILWSIDQSLKRLGTDHVDLYIAHRQDVFTPLEETVEAFDAVVRAGKARYIGFSNWTAWAAAAALEIQRANGLARFTHGQMYYSLLGRDIERDVIPMMQRYGLGLTVWSPLAFGLLSGKYTRENLNDPGLRVGGFDLLESDKEQAFSVVDVLRELAQARGAPVAQVALAWLLSREAVTSVILGASKVSQLRENVGALDVALSGADIERLDRATALARVYPNWFVYDIADKDLSAALNPPPSSDRQLGR
jgi:aryl-alcohol dehydrogenase-like predicted oxidoreductase